MVTFTGSKVVQVTCFTAPENGWSTWPDEADDLCYVVLQSQRASNPPLWSAFVEPLFFINSHPKRKSSWTSSQNSSAKKTVLQRLSMAWLHHLSLLPLLWVLQLWVVRSIRFLAILQLASVAEPALSKSLKWANAKPVQNGLALILKGEFMYTSHFISFSRSFLQDQSGVTAVEYGLIAALIAVAILISLGTLGTAIGTLFSNLATCFNTGNCIF